MEVFFQEIATVRAAVTIVDREHAAALHLAVDEVVESLLRVEQDADSVFVVGSHGALVGVHAEGLDRIEFLYHCF